MTDHRPFFHRRISDNRWAVFETVYTRAPYLTCHDEDRAHYLADLLNQDRATMEVVKSLPYPGESVYES